MFRFLRKKPKANPPQMGAFFEPFLGPPATAIALTETVGKHVERIRAGEVPFPILEAKEATTVQAWHHLRLEACIGAFGFGEGSLFELADVGKSREAFSEFLDHKAHLYFPQPSGGIMAQSVQAMWQVYLYLGQAGTSVADPATDRFLLGAAGRSIVSDLEREAKISQDGLFVETAELLPLTLFGLFFDDLNRKTKSIALSRLLGTSQLKEAPGAIEEIRSARGDEFAEQFRQLIEVVVSSSNPDEAVKRTAHLSIADYI